MTDDQTPGVAAMGAKELIACIIKSNDDIRDYEDEYDISYPSPEFTEHERLCAVLDSAVEEAERRLAAGPTLAEVRQRIADHMAITRHPQEVTTSSIMQALTALRPDGEHQADTVTISRADLMVAISCTETISGMAALTPKAQADAKKGFDVVTRLRAALATARPHQADPQEAM